MQETRLKFLNEISTRLQGLIDSDNFYQDLTSIIQKTFNYYSLQFWTPGPAESVVLRAQSGAYGRHLKIGHSIGGGRSSLGGITGHVLRTKKSYFARDVAKDPNFTSLSLPINSRAQITVPVLRNKELMAILSVESDKTDSVSDEDLITLEAVAAQLSVAITNRRLFKSVRDFSHQLQAAVDEKTEELRKAQERILQQQKLLQKENKALKTLVGKTNENFEIIGRSPAILNLLTMVDKIAPTLATVLLQGESGTGKELIARRLHLRSERVDKPYVVVNCGALQETLLESELFGHEKGAFTGAMAQKQGLVETADGGTLFLDEIGEMSLSIQSKLLRFLQEGEFYRIGGKRSLKVDVRVISATNRDLEKEVRENRFREDLFYRLNTITLRVPPLRKRHEDIPALVEYFLQNSRFGTSSQQITKIDPNVFDAFSQYSWPGNIRELQNTVERLRIFAEGNQVKLEDLPFGIRAPQKNANGSAEGSDYSANLALEEVEKHHILRALAFHHGNKTKTAHGLGITIKTLYNKLHRYGVLQTKQGEAHGA